MIRRNKTMTILEAINILNSVNIDKEDTEFIKARNLIMQDLAKLRRLKTNLAHKKHAVEENIKYNWDVETNEARLVLINNILRDLEGQYENNIWLNKQKINFKGVYMDKNILIQYTDMQQEIAKLEKRIDRVKQLSDMASDVVQNRL